MYSAAIFLYMNVHVEQVCIYSNCI